MYIRLSPYNIDVAATITVPVLYGTSTSIDAFEKACRKVLEGTKR